MNDSHVKLFVLHKLRRRVYVTGSLFYREILRKIHTYIKNFSFFYKYFLPILRRQSIFQPQVESPQRKRETLQPIKYTDLAS